MTSTHSEDLDRLWSGARRYSRLLSPVPDRISAALGRLYTFYLDSEKKRDIEVPEACYSAVAQIEKTASLKLPLYFAAATLYPNKFKTAEDNTERALLSALEPGLFSVFTALIYYYKRINTLTTHPGWEQLAKDYLLNMEIGFLLGSTVPGLGAADGTLIGGIRFAALGAMMLKDPSTFDQVYNSGNVLDWRTEQEAFGTDHRFVTAQLMQIAGLHSATDEIQRALCADTPKDVIGTEGFKIWPLAVRLIEGLKQNNFSASKSHDTDESLTLGKLLAGAQERVNNLLESGSTFTWVTRCPKKDS